MTFYQELQLNQAGSKALIKNCTTSGEKLRHTFVYLFKIFITMVFCVAFVMGYGKIFGNENSIVGVIILLCVMVFRNADFGMKMTGSLTSMAIIFSILAFGPRLANMAGLFGELLINAACIFVLLFLGCHNIMMSNHSTIVLGYLLLYGYDTTGKDYLFRLAAIATGALLTGIVFYRNHHKIAYKRTLSDIVKEFRIDSLRTRWQITVTFGVSTAIFLGGLFHIPRTMWIGIAAMSILMPFRNDLKGRVKGRIPGNIIGGVVFLALYLLFSPSILPYIGMIGGVGVGLSASYKWQAVFNSLGAMAIATAILGLPGAILFRILNNILGSVYGQLFEKISSNVLDRFTASASCASGRYFFYLKCSLCLPISENSGYPEESPAPADLHLQYTHNGNPVPFPSGKNALPPDMLHPLPDKIPAPESFSLFRLPASADLKEI